MDAKINGLDMRKVIGVLISLLEEQEHVKITYTIEEVAENEGKDNTA